LRFLYSPELPAECSGQAKPFAPRHTNAQARCSGIAYAGEMEQAHEVSARENAW
jgi:hypothetical protein